jgi:hypothetical protein
MHAKFNNVKYSIFLAILLLDFSATNAQKLSKSFAGGVGVTELIGIGAYKDYFASIVFFELSKATERWEFSSRLSFVQSSKSKYSDASDFERIRNISMWQLEGVCRYRILKNRRRGYVNAGAGPIIRYRSQTLPVEYVFLNNQLVSRKDEYIVVLEPGLATNIKSEIMVKKTLFFETSISIGLFTEGFYTMTATFGIVKKI